MPAPSDEEGHVDGTTEVAGRYELGESLGAGGMAQVHRAHDRLLGREVAVKVFGASVDPHGPDRVRAEMRTLAGLSHPGLVTLYDAGTDTVPLADGTTAERAFLVMQLVDGPSLAARLHDGPLSPAEARELGIEVAAALAYVHARDVVHRDIKPANILLDPTGRALIADFGIAQTLGQEALTAEGFTLGTVPYLSPEQVRGRVATAASDVYALGLVLLEVLTGRREYPGMTAEGALARLSRPPVVPGSLPAPWSALLPAMTALDPADRPDAARVAAWLRDEQTAATPVPAAPAAADVATAEVAVPAGTAATVVGAPAATSVLRTGASAGAASEAPTDAPTEALVPAQREGRRRAAALVAVGVLALGGLLSAGLALGQDDPAAPASNEDAAPTSPTTAPVVAPVVATSPAATRITPSPTASRATTRPTARATTPVVRSTRAAVPAAPAAPAGPGKTKDRTVKPGKPGKVVGAPAAKAGLLGPR